MTEAEFTAQYSDEWDRLEREITAARFVEFDLPLAHLRLCEQLAYAEANAFSASLRARLNRIALAGHRRLYGQKRRSGWFVVYEFFAEKLPNSIYFYRFYLLLAAVIFVLPSFLGLTVGLVYPDIAALGHSEYVDMYDPAQRNGSRLFDADIYMFGYYILHNTSIGLRNIGGSLFFGIGGIVSLAYNGWEMGIVAALMMHEGFAAETFFPFVATHSAPELTAVVLSAAVGLALAKAFLFPGRKLRRNSIKEATVKLFPLLLFMVLLFFIAAFLEAFWSPRNISRGLKYTVAGMVWFSLIWYFYYSLRRFVNCASSLSK
ncbi:MAG: stage II sporulation protein M [Cardiobacteriaceae bacterium]|nr:stage II sporulation protein M [Cardiobacteriaceae bacterium]